MSIVAYTSLHYGKEYLEYAVRSVCDVVDRHIILYTARPSYGHSTTLQCPDTEEELQECVRGFDHIEWVKGEWNNESQHRGEIHRYLRASDEILLPVDADEVWDETSLVQAIQNAKYKINRVAGFIHLWRSFGWHCTDSMAPVRVINLKARGESYISGTVYHFGYAQTLTTVQYKWAVHGHLPELRPGWLDRYASWQPGQDDVHPTCVGIWKPRPFEKEEMPLFMREHPYWNKGLIE